MHRPYDSMLILQNIQGMTASSQKPECREVQTLLPRSLVLNLYWIYYIFAVGNLYTQLLDTAYLFSVQCGVSILSFLAPS